MRFREPCESPSRLRESQGPQHVPLNPALLALQRVERVLLLQGPVGPFFDRLASWLLAQRKCVHRVVFQGGDRADCRVLDPLSYTGTPAEWPAFFKRTVAELGIECIVLFGQSRYYHRVAIELAQALGIEVVVLEEGYLRPGFVTMELGGVNGYSRTLARYRWQSTPENPALSLPRPEPEPWLFQQMCWFAARHYMAMRLNRREFAHYQHHKSESLGHYAAYWLRAWGKKLFKGRFDHLRVKALAGQPYFFVPLQHDGDSQITHHSPFNDNTEFILQVLRSFATHAPQDCKLVFKTHPFSRGGPTHAGLIHALSRELGIRDRVLHLLEGHIPTLLDHARGVVVINSTVGLQALVHGKPLAVKGEALYKLEGISYMGQLDRFWTHARPPVAGKLNDLMDQLRHLTQAPCHVYDRRSAPLNWSVPSQRQAKQ